MYCIVLKLLQHSVTHPRSTPHPIFVSPQITEPSNDRNIKDQGNSSALSSSGPLANMGKMSPWQVTHTWALARALVNNINKG